MGIVKWFNTTEGFGFIKPEDGGPDIFVHISGVQKAGYANLAEGAREICASDEYSEAGLSQLPSRKPLQSRSFGT
jgi:cold shock CspA family protein